MGAKDKPSTTRVAIYIRVSTTHQIDRDSLPMQRNDLLAYAKLMLGTEDCVIFEDAGYSGKNTDRPKFQQMMTQIRNGVFTHLLVWKIDRISRNLLDFASMYAELKRLGVTFISKNEQFDTSTAMGEAMLKIILVFAELERNITSERVTATMISRASNGQWNGGRVPFGYSWDPEKQEFYFNRNEYDIVKLIHDKYEEFQSLVEECRWMNGNGYLTRSGSEWRPSTLRIVLRSIFYCGDYRYNMFKEGGRSILKDESEWVTVENHHPAIVSREQKERIIQILESNARTIQNRGVSKPSGYVHVFGDIIHCGNCGKKMGGSPHCPRRGLHYSTYTCYTQRSVSSNCRSTSDPTVGEFLFNYILNMLNAQRNFDNIHSPEELEKQLLLGNTFQYIDRIEESGLNDLYNMLSSEKVQTAIYGRGVNIKIKKKKVSSELDNLRKKKLKLERALDRLTNLYLYADESMSDTEFIVQKSKLSDSLEEVNEQIGFLKSDSAEQSVSDEVFVQRASEFIIAQKLDGRNYISYKRLASSVDPEVLQSFVQGIMDSIIMDSGKVKQVIFKNGLSHTFVFK